MADTLVVNTFSPHPQNFYATHTHTKYEKRLKNPNDIGQKRGHCFYTNQKITLKKKKQKDWSKERTLFVHKPKYNSKKKKSKKIGQKSERGHCF